MINKLQNDLKDAQLNRDETRVSTLRLLLSEIKNTQIAKGGQLSNQDIVPVIQREVKKRKEATEAFRKGGREEQALKEETELKILQDYLPAQMEVDQLTKIVLDTINELGAKSIADMGRVMGGVMNKVKGQADGTTVSVLVKERLSK